MAGADLLALYRNDFRTFLHFLHQEAHPDQPFMDGWHLDVMADALMGCLPGGSGRLILNAPPRSLKSFTASIAWPLFLLGRIPNLEITVVAGTQELASDFVELRERLLRSPRLLAVFPSLRYRAIGQALHFQSGGKLAQGAMGRSLIGRGSDLIIIDDPLTPTQAEDEQRRAAVNSWYAMEIAPRLNSDGGTVVVAMQRLHVDDLCGHLLGGPERWRQVALSAIAQQGETWPLANGVVRRRKRGEALCPDRTSLAELRKKLRSLGGRNFSAQYLQAPSHRLSDHYIKTMMKVMVPLPGFEHLNRPKMGFFHVSVTNDVLINYFGEPNPFDTTGLRAQTGEESEHEAVEMQARMLAEMEEDIARKGL